jgi:perosamine synthetase
VISQNNGNVGLHEPSFKGREECYVTDCLKTGWVSSAGSYVDRFESSLTEYTGAKYAMIGNAVSPPVSKLIAKRVLDLLRENNV